MKKTLTFLLAEERRFECFGTYILLPDHAALTATGDTRRVVGEWVSLGALPL